MIEYKEGVTEYLIFTAIPKLYYQIKLEDGKWYVYCKDEPFIEEFNGFMLFESAVNAIQNDYYDMKYLYWATYGKNNDILNV